MAFAKREVQLRKAAQRTIRGLWNAIGQFAPDLSKAPNKADSMKVTIGPFWAEGRAQSMRAQRSLRVAVDEPGVEIDRERLDGLVRQVSGVFTRMNAARTVPAKCSTNR